MTERPPKRQRSESYGDGGRHARRDPASRIPANAYVAYHSFHSGLFVCFLHASASFCKTFVREHCAALRAVALLAFLALLQEPFLAYRPRGMSHRNDLNTS